MTIARDQLVDVTGVIDFKRYGCHCVACKGDKGDPNAIHKAGGAPRVKGTDGKWYTMRRPSSFGKPLKNSYGLDQWRLRTAAYGVATTKALAAKIANLDPKADKDALNTLAQQAIDAAKGNEARDLGTELHTVIERLNRGEWDIDDVPDIFRNDAEAYLSALDRHGLEVVPGMVELRVVNDELKAAGTFDMMLAECMVPMTADLKTGQSIDLAQVGYSVQLALYSRATGYDVVKDERYDIPATDRDVGLIVHLPFDSGRCDIIDVDLTEGWRAAELAAEALSWQRRKDLFTVRKIAQGGTTNATDVVGVVQPVGTVETPNKPRRPARILPSTNHVDAPDEVGAANDADYAALQDEGKAASKDAIKLVLRWRAQPKGVWRWVTSGDDGKVTVRRVAISRAALALAEFCVATATVDGEVYDDGADATARAALEEVMGDDVQTHPVGELLARLTPDECRRLMEVLG